MKIQEIYINPSRDEFLESYLHYFAQISHQETLRTGLVLKVAVGNNMMHIGVFDKDKIVSYVGLHKTMQHNQIDMQCSVVEYQGQGYIRKCIEYAIEHFTPVISDAGQTKEAQKVWMALIRLPNTIQYFWLNLSTDEKIPLVWDNHTNSPNPNPWDDSDETVILGIPRPVTNMLREMRARREQFDIARGRRDRWLGTGFTEFNP